MRCLMCGELIRRDSFTELFQKEDVLCPNCREKWKRISRSFRFEGHDAFALYAYDSGFSECLLQYKELCDEALKPVFLYPDIGMLRRMYRGRTLLLLPSAPQDVEYRGFSHLRGIFEWLKLPVMEPFEKISGRSQKNLGKEERAAMRTDIRLKNGVRIPRRVVLADDVITTGSTMKGALSVLPEGLDIRIFACGLAEAPKERAETGGMMRFLHRGTGFRDSFK